MSNSNIIWTGIGSFSLSIILIVAGNLSISFAWAIENELILYSLTVYIVCNWGGLNDLWLSENGRDDIIKKMQLDYLYLVIIVGVLSLIPALLKYRVYVLLPLFLYPFYGIFYWLRRDNLYATASVGSFFWHILAIYICATYDNDQLYLAFFFSIFISLGTLVGLQSMRLFIKGSVIETLNSKSSKGEPVRSFVFYKLALSGMLLGEIDRYILAYYLDAKIAILYLTIGTTVGFVPNVLVAMMRYYVNEYKINGAQVPVNLALWALMIIAPVGMIVLIKMGHDASIVVSLSVALTVKYYYVIKSMPIMIRFYSTNKIDSLFWINTKVNLYGLVVNSIFLFGPASFLITASSKIASAIPLYLLDKKTSKYE